MIINKKFALVLVFECICISFLWVALAGYYSFEINYELSSTLGITSRAQKISTADPKKFINVAKDFDGPFLIWQRNDHSSYVGVLFRGNFSLPHVLEGGFIRESDFFSAGHVAAIGRARAPDANPFPTSIEIFGAAYRVVGTVGYAFESGINHAAYYNLDSLQIANTFYIDGKTSVDIEHFIHELSRKIDIVLLDDPVNGINRLMGLSNHHAVILGMFSLALLIFFTLCLRAGFSVFQEAAFIQNILGESLHKIAARTALRLSGTMFIICMICTVACLVFGLFPMVFLTHLMLLLVGYLILILVAGMGLYWYSYRRIRRITI